MLFSCAHQVFVFQMNFRSKPCVVCPDPASGLFVESPVRAESWIKRWRHLVLIQKIHTDAASVLWLKEGSYIWARVCVGQRVEWSSCHKQSIQIFWTLIYTDIKNCRYVDNRNNGFTKDWLTKPWKCHLKTILTAFSETANLNEFVSDPKFSKNCF